jgi:hypothetical protein
MAKKTFRPQRPLWLRRVRFYGTAGALLIAAIVIIWPVFKGGELAGPFFRETRSFMLEGLLWAFFLPFILSVISIGLLLAAGNIGNRFSWSWLESLAERALKPVVTAEVVLMVVSAAGVMLAAAVRFSNAPATAPAKFVQMNMIDVKVSPFIRNLGPYTLQRANAKLSGPYLALENNVISLTGFPPLLVLPEPVETVSDIHLRQDTLLVVTGQDLIQVHSNGKVGLVAALPMPGMRIGLRAIPHGLSTTLLLAGTQDGKGAVFEVRGDSTYSKLLAVDEPVVGAAGCLDWTAAALSDRVVVARPGFRPRILMQLPKNSGPITSILARLEKGVLARPNSDPQDDMADSCLWLVATRDGVYGHQSGMTALMIAGLGGNLSAYESEGLGFTLTDNTRETVVSVSFKREAAEIGMQPPRMNRGMAFDRALAKTLSLK